MSFLNVKLAFISGATSGLGKELAYLLAEKKVPLFLSGKDLVALESLEKELRDKTTVFTLKADLTSKEELSLLLNAIKEKKPDLVINSAGLGFYGDVLSFPLEKQMLILQVNVQALTAITIESARALQGQKGTIMNISSAAANYIYPSFAIYAASKRFVKDFSLSFDKELSKQGIRILTSLPGRFPSCFQQKASPLQAPGKGMVPLQKMAKLILQQIEKQKGCEIHDFRYKLLFFLSRLMPNSLLCYFLKANR